MVKSLMQPTNETPPPRPVPSLKAARLPYNSVRQAGMLRRHSSTLGEPRNLQAQVQIGQQPPHPSFHPRNIVFPPLCSCRWTLPGMPTGFQRPCERGTLRSSGSTRLRGKACSRPCSSSRVSRSEISPIFLAVMRN